MASWFDTLKQYLGKDPTDEQMRDLELMKQAGPVLQEQRKKEWTEENKEKFGLTGETPQDQLRLDEENAKKLTGEEQLKNLTPSESKG